MIRIVTMSVLVLAAAALADDYEQRSKLTGSWQVETTGAKEAASSWILQPLPDGMHIAGSSGGKTLVEFDCKMAKECDIKDSGRHAKVTMYFNGAKLIENETIGSRVIRRRFTVTGDGNMMELEVIPIEPEGKTETIVFKRVTTEAAKQ
jgi:hypothetical protein